MWPPPESKVDEWIKTEWEPTQVKKPPAEVVPISRTDACFGYATKVCMCASGGKMWGPTIWVDPDKWGLTPYLDDEVKGALDFLAAKVEEEPVWEGGHMCRAERLSTRGFGYVIRALMEQNMSDADTINKCARLCVAMCKFPKARGCFRSAFLRERLEKVEPPSEVVQKAIDFLK